MRNAKSFSFTLACENSRPSSLPAEWRFAFRLAKRHSAGSEEGRLFSQATFTYSTSEFSVKLVSFKVGLKDSTNV